MKYLLIILMILFIGCKNNSPESNKPDKIIFKNNLKIDCFKDKMICDTITKYYCIAYDTLSKITRTKGYFYIYNDNLMLPKGWITYWDAKGKLLAKKDFVVFNNSRKGEVNQWIIFGKNSHDTIFEDSHFITHNLSYLNKDTVSIYFRYRGWRENISNYAFTARTDKYDEFIFRSNKPEIFIKLPIKKFVKDSVIFFTMIKSNDSDIGEDMINIQHIYYNISF